MAEESIEAMRDRVAANLDGMRKSAAKGAVAPENMQSMRRGPKSDYDARVHPVVVAGLRRRGFTLQEVAQTIGKSVRTLGRWSRQYPEMRAALKEGVDASDARVESSLFDKALSGDVTACIFWLKNRRPDAWRDKANIEHTGKDGGPIAIQDAADADLIAEAEAILAAACAPRRDNG